MPKQKVTTEDLTLETVEDAQFVAPEGPVATLVQGLSAFDERSSQWVQLVAGWAAGRSPNQQGSDNVLREAINFADQALYHKELRFPSNDS